MSLYNIDGCHNSFPIALQKFMKKEYALFPSWGPLQRADIPTMLISGAGYMG